MSDYSFISNTAKPNEKTDLLNFKEINLSNYSESNSFQKSKGVKKIEIKETNNIDNNDQEEIIIEKKKFSNFCNAGDCKIY